MRGRGGPAHTTQSWPTNIQRQLVDRSTIQRPVWSTCSAAPSKTGRLLLARRRSPETSERPDIVESRARVSTRAGQGRPTVFFQPGCDVVRSGNPSPDRGASMPANADKRSFSNISVCFVEIVILTTINRIISRSSSLIGNAFSTARLNMCATHRI